MHRLQALPKTFRVKIDSDIPVSSGQTDGRGPKRPVVFAFHECSKGKESLPSCLELPLTLVLGARSVRIERALKDGAGGG